MAAAPPPGYVFRPADHDLIGSYLRPRVAGEPFDGRFFHVADAYSLVPELLVDGRQPAPGSRGKDVVWYFFSPANRHKGVCGGGRRQRAVGDGCCWHSEGRDKDVLDAQGRRVGYVRKLSYGVKKAPPERGFTRLGWCMAEFGLDDRQDGEVICKVYRSPRAPVAAEASITVVPASISSPCKRKAAGDHPEAPASVRPQCSREEEVQGLESHLVPNNPTAIGDEDSAVGLEFMGSNEQMSFPQEQYVDAGVEMVQTTEAGVEMVQTTEFSDADVIAARAMGATVDDLLGSEEPTSSRGNIQPYPELLVSSDDDGNNLLQPCPDEPMMFPSGSDYLQQCPEPPVSSSNGGGNLLQPYLESMSPSGAGGMVQSCPWPMMSPSGSGNMQQPCPEPPVSSSEGSNLQQPCPWPMMSPSGGGNMQQPYPEPNQSSSCNRGNIQPRCSAGVVAPLVVPRMEMATAWTETDDDLWRLSPFGSPSGFTDLLYSC